MAETQIETETQHDTVPTSTSPSVIATQNILSNRIPKNDNAGNFTTIQKAEPLDTTYMERLSISQPILSPNDELKFDDNLVRNKSSVVVTRSKTKRAVLHLLPLYFGTNEKDFSVYRKRALLKRRQSSNPKYPKTELGSGNHFSRITNSNLKVKIRLHNSVNESLLVNPVVRAVSGGQEKNDLIKQPLSKASIKWSEAIQGNERINKKSKNVTHDEIIPIEQKNEITEKSEVVPQSVPTTMLPGGLISLKVMYEPNYLSSIMESSKSQLVHPHGLINAGSICYMNSVLQMLFECEPFSQLLNIWRNNTVASLGTSKTPLIDALILLHDSFKKSSIGEKNSGINTVLRTDSIDPFPFYSSIKKLDRFHNLEWGRQEDAEEFLGYLMDGLHEEFVSSIEDLSMDEVQKFANSMHDESIAEKIVYTVKSIKESKGKGCGTEIQGEGEDGEGWNEVGSHRKIAVKRSFVFKPSPIALLFGGQFRSILQISGSKKSSITLDPFMHIQLDISSSDITDLEGAFKKFSEVEEISYGNQTAKKQNLIDKIPEILIIHLKRFSFVMPEDSEDDNNRYEIVSSKQKRRKHSQQASIHEEPSMEYSKKQSEGKIEKIMKCIAYPHHLKLPSSCISATVNDEPTYKLVGVIYHHGRSAEGGHYTADVREPSGRWVRIDDTQVTQITDAEVIENGLPGGNLANKNKSAYLLMYQKM